MDDMILDRLEDHSERNYEYAGKGKRFTNYLIDIIFYYIFSMILGGIYGAFIATDAEVDEFLVEPTTVEGQLMDSLLGMLMLVVYYTIVEYSLKGKTIGKYITRTRAVTLDNQRLDFATTLKRSLCRIIPFEAFSFLGDRPDGWHDRIPKTKVILDDDWIEEDSYDF